MARSSPAKTLISYSIAMITLPIMGYFLSKYVLEMVTDKQSANIYSAIASVIIIHIILIGFVYVAFTEDKHLTAQQLKTGDKTD